MEKISLLKLLGLPSEFGLALLILSLILLLAPYFAGHDFGVFKIPPFKYVVKKKLKIIGPILFILILISEV